MKLHSRELAAVKERCCSCTIRYQQLHLDVDVMMLGCVVCDVGHFVLSILPTDGTSLRGDVFSTGGEQADEDNG